MYFCVTHNKFIASLTVMSNSTFKYYWFVYIKLVLRVLPQSDLPQSDLPQIDLPQIDLPQSDLPQIDLPQSDSQSFHFSLFCHIMSKSLLFGIKPRTLTLCSLCSATELWQLDKHHPLQSSLCTAQVLLIQVEILDGQQSLAIEARTPVIFSISQE